MDKWIEIARAGTFTDSAGRPQTFTAGDLVAIAGAYDPQKRDCPLVFGHPQSDSAPAFGWARKLKAEGGKLLALFDKVPEQVRALVDAGHYRHVSMSLMPDRKTLRHVALLGAAQPAIDGLKAVELADGADCVTVEFAARDGGGLAEEQAATCSRRSDLASPAGRGGARYQNKEATMPDDAQREREIGALKERLAALEKENENLKKQAQAHKEDKDKAEVAKNKAETAKTEAEAKAEKTASDFAAYREQVATEKREARVSALVAAGKIKPAEKAGVLEFAAALAASGGTIDFAAQDGKSEKITLEEKYLREQEARPEDPRFAEFSAPPAHAGEGAPACNYEEMVKKL